MSLWQELEGLQKKKAELDGQFTSFLEQVKTFEERIKVIDGGLGVQEERMRKLEVQLEDKNEAMIKLESEAAGLEKILKKPMIEPEKEEVVKEEPEKQPIEVTVQTATSGSQQQQTVGTEERQKEEKKRKHWL